MKISVAIPTRGDVDVQPISNHLKQYPEIQEVIWYKSNSVYGRFKAINKTTNDIIYTQDDDVITDLRPIIDAYRPGIIVNAMTTEHAAHYKGSQTLIGFGAVFDKSLVKVLDGWDFTDELNRRTCDRIFTALTEHMMVFPKIEHMSYATADNRMYRQPKHFGDRVEITKRIFKKTGITDDPK